MSNQNNIKKEQTNFEEMIAKAVKDDKRTPKGLFITLIILMATIIVMGILLFMGESNKKKSFKTSKLNQMQEMVGKIKTLESEMNKKRNQVFDLMREYKTKTGKDIPTANILNLSEKEKRVLEDKIDKEQNVSIKSLIQDLLAKNRDLLMLKERIRGIEKLLPASVIVALGENHYQIAMSYLLNQRGVLKNNAQELVEKCMLYDTLLPGFKVWNFYSGDEFGTFITQGGAEVSPNALRRKAKKKLIDAKDSAIAERDVLAKEIKVLQDTKKSIIFEVNLLSLEKNKLIEKLNILSQKKKEFQKKLNSLFYIVDTQNELKEKGILKGGFLAALKLSDFSPQHFHKSIDLRKNKTIVLAAKNFNLEKISKINIYPGYYKEGEDYRIEYLKEKKTVLITLISIEKIKNERVVISLK